jgi:hypothetical protein
MVERMVEVEAEAGTIAEEDTGVVAAGGYGGYRR